MARSPRISPLNKTTKSVRMPATENLTRNAFELKPDGTVLIKDKALAKILQDSVPGAINDADTKAVKVSVGVDF